MAVTDGTDGPVDEEAGIEVKDGRQVERATAPNDELGRVADPPLVRRVGDEVLAEEIRRDGLVMIAHGCAREPLPHPRGEAFRLFQPDDALPTDLVPLVP